jgi:hypothetical protein
MTRLTRATQVLALLLVALAMGLEFAHTLELGPKLNYPPELYLQLNTSLYAWFGPPLGAAIWLGAIVATGALAWVVRSRSAQLLTGAAFALLLVALANYFARVESVNGQIPRARARRGASRLHGPARAVGTRPCGGVRPVRSGIPSAGHRPPVAHGRELDGTDVSRQNVGAVEFTTSTAGPIRRVRSTRQW